MLSCKQAQLARLHCFSLFSVIRCCCHSVCSLFEVGNWAPWVDCNAVQAGALHATLPRTALALITSDNNQVIAVRLVDVLGMFLHVVV